MDRKFYVKYNKCCCCGRFEQKEFATQDKDGEISFRADDEHYKTKEDWLRLCDSSQSEIFDDKGHTISYKSFWYKVHPND